MATAVSARPTGPPPKAKRPIPPTLQTTNGTSSHGSSSPSLSSKRPPTGFKQPPNAGISGSNGNTTPNGTGPRLVRRKDSHKVIEANKPRPSKASSTDNPIAEKRPLKKILEPYGMLGRNMMEGRDLQAQLNPPHTC
jgi:hypothetical protein